MPTVKLQKTIISAKGVEIIIADAAEPEKATTWLHLLVPPQTNPPDHDVGRLPVAAVQLRALDAAQDIIAQETRAVRGLAKRYERIFREVGLA